MDSQAYRPVILFLNGEYWGIHNIRERYDRHYLDRVYGIEPGNIDFWRLRTPYNPHTPKGHDGRWRWMLFYVDYAFGLTRRNFYMIEWLNQKRKDHWSIRIIGSLLESEMFRHAFINRIADHLNSAFSPERVRYYIDSLGRAIEPGTLECCRDGRRRLPVPSGGR